jgi:hypothetical protein
MKVVKWEDAVLDGKLYKAYIAGPMRGYPMYNFPAFDKATEMLREEGFIVTSPADLDRKTGFDPNDPDAFAKFDLDAAIDRDIDAIRALDREHGAVALLSGWEKSTGARAEAAYATWRGLTLILMPGAEPAAPATPQPDDGRIIGPIERSATFGPMDPWPTPAVVEERQKLGRLPAEATDRKTVPLCTGVLDYFPDALAEVARVSRVGNEQHNPGQPLHWAKEKSTDHADALLRHLVDRGKRDAKDEMRHSAKVAWRALALLQREIDAEIARRDE